MQLLVVESANVWMKLIAWHCNRRKIAHCIHHAFANRTVGMADVIRAQAPMVITHALVKVVTIVVGMFAASITVSFITVGHVKKRAELFAKTVVVVGAKFASVK